MTEFTSPLKAWPGRFTLPDPDDFSRVHWDAFKDSFNKPARTVYADIHHYGYAGLELIEKFGKWDMKAVIKDSSTEEETEKLPISAVRSWETSPAAERTKLIAWIGREIDRYISRVVDPKE